MKTLPRITIAFTAVLLLSATASASVIWANTDDETSVGFAWHGGTDADTEALMNNAAMVNDRGIEFASNEVLMIETEQAFEPDNQILGQGGHHLASESYGSATSQVTISPKATATLNDIDARVIDGLTRSLGLDDMIVVDRLSNTEKDAIADTMATRTIEETKLAMTLIAGSMPLAEQ